MGTARKSRPRFRREGEAPRVQLTEDDAAILQCIYQHRFVRAEDIYRLFPTRTPDRLSRRLTALYRAKYLDRPISQIDRYHKGGSQSLVYGLDTAGARYLKEALGSRIGATDWRARNRSYTRENLDHTLAVSRFMIDLEVACRARGDLSVIPLEEILARAPEATQRAAIPGRWPVDVSFYGARGVVHLVPDAIFGLRMKMPDGKHRSSYFFLEVDRGTMTISPAQRVRESEAFIHRSSILRKLVAYAESWQQGLHKEHLGLPSARVLFVTTADARARLMAQAAEQYVVGDIKIPPGLFLFGRLGLATPPTTLSGQPVVPWPSHRVDAFTE